MFAGAQRACFDNLDFVAELGFVVLIVGHELFANSELLAIERMSLARLHSNNNSLVDFVRRYHADY